MKALVYWTGIYIFAHWNTVLNQYDYVLFLQSVLILTRVLRPHTCQRQTWCWWPAGGRAETVLGKPGCGTAGEGYVEWSSALQLTRTQQWYSTPHIQPETHERTVQWSYTKNNSTFSSRVQHTRQQAPRRKPHVTMSTSQTHETCW